MLYLKACPRCTGDLAPTEDEFGSYLYCVQCGNHLSGAQLAAYLLSSTELAAAGPESDGWAAPKLGAGLGLTAPAER